MPRTQRLSHCVSCGHTRPQTAGRLESMLMTRYAPSMSPSLIFAMKSGIFIPTGQPPTQAGFLQLRQRAASFAASLSEYPTATSSKLRARAAASSSGIGVFFGSVFTFAIMNLHPAALRRYNNTIIDLTGIWPAQVGGHCPLALFAFYALRKRLQSRSYAWRSKSR